MTNHILVADDSPAARSLVAAALDGLGDVEVSRVSSGLEALRLLTTSQIDLVLTDIHMPEINGLELVRMIKNNEHSCRTPVIIMSTESNDSDREAAISSGADEFLAKPFTSELLRATISRYLNKIHPSAE